MVKLEIKQLKLNFLTSNLNIFYFVNIDNLMTNSINTKFYNHVT